MWHPFDTSKLISEIKNIRAHLKNLECLLKNLEKGAQISYTYDHEKDLLKKEIDHGYFSVRLDNLMTELGMINYGDLYELMNSEKIYKQHNIGKKTILEVERFFFSRGYFYK